MAGRGVPREGVDCRCSTVSTGTTDRSEALAQPAGCAGVDRAYLFQNMRGPDGRLWMDLIGEWTAPRCAPSSSRSPARTSIRIAPTSRLDRRVRRRRRGRRTRRASFRSRSAACSLAEGTVSAWLVPILRGDGMVGVPGVRRGSRRAPWTDAMETPCARWRGAIGDAVRAGAGRTEQIRGRRIGSARSSSTARLVILHRRARRGAPPPST